MRNARPENNSEETPNDQRDTAKELTKAIAKLVALKNAYVVAVAAHAEVIHLSATDPAWCWATEGKVLDDLRKAVTVVHELKNSSPFWKALCAEEKLHKWARDQPHPVVKAHAGQEDMPAAVKKLKQEADRLKSMHKAKTAGS